MKIILFYGGNGQLVLWVIYYINDLLKLSLNN